MSSKRNARIRAELYTECVQHLISGGHDGLREYLESRGYIDVTFRQMETDSNYWVVDATDECGAVHHVDYDDRATAANFDLVAAAEALERV